MLDRVRPPRRRPKRDSDPGPSRGPGAAPAGAVTRAVDALRDKDPRRSDDLRAVLAEQHGRLGEMSHRFKNNLQTLSAIALLKARRTADAGARRALEDMADRIAALSTAFRVADLASGDDDRFDAKALFAELATELADGAERDRIALALDLEPAMLSGAAAAPLALLVSELVGNALRHAFPGGRAGRLRVSLRREGAAVRIAVEDDGVGVGRAGPPSEALGRALCEMLARQVGAQIAWEDAEPGTRVVVCLPGAPGSGR